MVEPVILSFRTAVEARDRDAMRAALHPDVVFNSPVAYQPYEGRDAVMTLLEHVVEVMPDLHYVDHLTGENSHTLVFRATVDGREVDGIDYCVVDEAGLVTELSVFVRPASGLMALGQAMGARLAASG